MSPLPGTIGELPADTVARFMKASFAELRGESTHAEKAPAVEAEPATAIIKTVPAFPLIVDLRRPVTLSVGALEAVAWLAMRARKNGLVAVAPRDRDPELLRGIDELIGGGLLEIPLDVIRSEGDLVLSLAPMMRRAG